jgi:hypothetical protein
VNFRVDLYPYACSSAHQRFLIKGVTIVQSCILGATKPCQGYLNSNVTVRERTYISACASDGFSEIVTTFFQCEHTTCRDKPTIHYMLSNNSQLHRGAVLRFIIDLLQPDGQPSVHPYSVPQLNQISDRIHFGRGAHASHLTQKPKNATHEEKD